MSNLDDAGSKERYSDGDCVDCELKLKELCDTVVDITSPHHRLDDTREVVVRQYDIGRFLGHVCTRNSLNDNTLSTVSISWRAELGYNHRPI